MRGHCREAVREALIGGRQFFAWGQRFGAEVYAGNDPGFEPPKTDPCVNG
jgi:hypothetical protein